MLGAVLAILSAATFAFNNAAARRGVITGSPIQGMAITIPVGLIGFVPLALVTGLVARFPHLAPRSIAWMAGVGLLHFLIGRYCNYRANQAAGVNLTAPVVQLQVFVSVVLAVILLGDHQSYFGKYSCLGAIQREHHRGDSSRSGIVIPFSECFELGLQRVFAKLRVRKARKERFTGANHG